MEGKYMSKRDSDDVLVPAAGAGVPKIDTLLISPYNLNTLKLDKRQEKKYHFFGEISLDIRNKFGINVRQLVKRDTNSIC